MSQPRDLPNFDQPPIHEVAVSLQFGQLSKFSYVDIGPLRDIFKERFPNVEYHPVLPPTFETFGLRSVATSQIQIRLAETVDLPRLWFVDNDGAQLVQFQNDRFVHNWRKSGSIDPYPRYESIRSRFVSELEVLKNFLHDRDLGKIIPNQCELTYVNMVKLPADEGQLPVAALSFWKPIHSDLLGPPEDVSILIRHIIRDSGGSPIGRLAVQAAPGLDREGNSVLQLSLIGRGPPAEPTIDAAMDFLDLARERIVRGFAELTTDVMHALWKRRD